VHKRSAKGSQPTYEELKPHSGPERKSSSTRSQPTYEELKRNYHRAHLNNAVGSQPTYEELKRVLKSYLKRGGKFSAYL